MSQRIPSLDLIRGIAILGILFMNVYIFTLPVQATSTPNWSGENSILDRWIYSFQYLFVHGRFYTLFAILFGAGLALLAEKWQAKGLDTDRWVKRRLLWLMLFGILHTWFIWYGDILLSYAFVALLIFSYHTFPTYTLIKHGLIAFLIGQVVFILLWMAAPYISSEFIPELMLPHIMTEEDIAAEITDWNQPYFAQVLDNMFMTPVVFLLGITSFWWEIAGLMLIGMALYKMDIFRTGFKTHYALLFLLTGLLLGGIDLLHQWSYDFTYRLDQFSTFYTQAALPIALFYIHVLVSLINRFPHAFKPLQNVGRMAFTLYIFQSVTMVIAFRWIWPEYFAQLSRLDCVLISLAVSLIQIILANLWLSRFKQGPLEAGWRYLTYRNA